MRKAIGASLILIAFISLILMQAYEIGMINALICLGAALIFCGIIALGAYLLTN